MQGTLAIADVLSQSFKFYPEGGERMVIEFETTSVVIELDDGTSEKHDVYILPEDADVETLLNALLALAEGK